MGTRFKEHLVFELVGGNRVSDRVVESGSGVAAVGGWYLEMLCWEVLVIVVAIVLFVIVDGVGVVVAAAGTALAATLRL